MTQTSQLTLGQTIEMNRRRKQMCAMRSSILLFLMIAVGCARVQPPTQPTLHSNLRAAVKSEGVETNQQPDEIASARPGSFQYVKMGFGTKESGFLLYSGKHQNCQIIALAADIGSGVPSEDLRIYVETDGRYRRMLEVPILTRRGFRCTWDADTLKVFLTKRYEDATQPFQNVHEKVPFITIDIQGLVDAAGKP